MVWWSPSIITSVLWFEISPMMTYAWNYTNRDGLLWGYFLFLFLRFPTQGIHNLRCEQYSFQLYHIFYWLTPEAKETGPEPWLWAQTGQLLVPAVSRCVMLGRSSTTKSEEGPVKPASWSCSVDWSSWRTYGLRTVQWSLEERRGSPCPWVDISALSLNSWTTLGK